MAFSLVFEVSDFTTVKFESALRCTLSWILRDEASGEVIDALSAEGCLVCRDSKGTLHFNPPLSRNGPMKFKTLKISEPHEVRLVRMIENSPYAGHIPERRPKVKGQVFEPDPLPEGLPESLIEELGVDVFTYEPNVVPKTS